MPDPDFQSPATRRQFLSRMAILLAASSVGLLGVRRARAAETRLALGRRAAWARLITPSPFWMLHREQDARIAAFLRDEARIDLDPTPCAVDPANLDELTAFPFVFTNGLTPIVDPRCLDNVKEYLQRGGFFYIEGCLDHRVTRNFTRFAAAHFTLYRKFFPTVELRRLSPAHPIFRACFPVEEKALALIEPTADDLRWQGAPQALYGLFLQERMISVISLDHLQCEWFTKAEKIPACLRQIANIYVYAMTR